MELLNLYGVSDETMRDGPAQLSREIWQKGWWDGYSNDVALRTMDHAWMESRARELRDFSTLVVYGLFQIEQYTEAVFRATDPEASYEQVKRWMEFRMTRRQTLPGANPLRLSSVLDEAVLHRIVGGPEVMRRQIDQILEYTAEDNIEVRVLSFSAGAHTSPESPFTYFTMPAPYPDVTYVPTEAGAIYVEMPEAAKFDAAYHRLESAAFDPKKSRALLQRRMSELT